MVGVKVSHKQEHSEFDPVVYLEGTGTVLTPPRIRVKLNVNDTRVYALKSALDSGLADFGNCPFSAAHFPGHCSCKHLPH